MDIIQGGPTPVVATPVDTSAARREAEAKEPPVPHVKPTQPVAAANRYAERKAATRDESRGNRVDIDA